MRRRAGAEDGWALVTAIMLMAIMATFALATATTVDNQQKQSAVGSSASGVSASRPKRVRHDSSTAAGVRKHVPELTSVVPPTLLASGSRIGTLPIVVTCPALR